MNKIVQMLNRNYPEHTNRYSLVYGYYFRNGIPSMETVLKNIKYESRDFVNTKHYYCLMQQIIADIYFDGFNKQETTLLGMVEELT